MELEQRLALGDDAAWREVIPPLLAVAFAVAKSRLAERLSNECQDVAMETLAEICKAKSRPTSERELKALTSAIAHRKAIDRIRHHSAAKRSGNTTVSLEQLHDSEAMSHPVGAHDQFLDHLTIQDLRELFIELGQSMKKKYRVVLHDHYFEQLSYAEVAAKRGISVNSVGVYIKRALDAMRAVINRQPRLKCELAELISDQRIVSILLPLATAVQLGGWFVDRFAPLFSERNELDIPDRPATVCHHTDTLTDGVRLAMSREQTPDIPVFSEACSNSLVSLLKEKR